MPDPRDPDLDAPSTDRPQPHAAPRSYREADVADTGPDGSGAAAPWTAREALDGDGGTDDTAGPAGGASAPAADEHALFPASTRSTHDPAAEVTPPSGLPVGSSATDEHLFADVDGPPRPPAPSADGGDDGEDDPVKRGSGGGASSFLRELPVLLAIAFVLAFLLRTFVVQVFYIPSSSMEPTLRIDDRMVVEKLTYRFREPVRGEVVVFEGENFGPALADEPLPTRIVRGVGQFLGVVPASARDFVKRVIGLPGDEVLIEEGMVYVNGELIDEPYVVYDDGSDFGPVTVPPDALFFLGDNRPNSSDSRRSLGYVPMDAVVGRAAYIIWPFDHADSLMDVEHEVPDAPPPEPEEDAESTAPRSSERDAA